MKIYHAYTYIMSTFITNPFYVLNQIHTNSSYFINEYPIPTHLITMPL